MQLMIGQDFETLEQRMLYYYIGTMPDFIPCECEGVSHESQKQLYAFLTGIPQLIYDTPALIGLKATPDAWYADFVMNKTNPDLIKQMRKTLSKMNKLYFNLIRIGQASTLVDGKLVVSKADVRFTKRTLAQFEALGLNSQVETEQIVYWSDTYPQVLPAFKYLADKVQERGNDGDAIMAFWRGMFAQGDTQYLASTFEVLLSANTAYQRLASYLEDHGYYKSADDIHHVRLDWVKNDGKPELKVNSPEAVKNYWGLSLAFDYRRKNQLTIALRLPKYKDVLEEFDTLSDEMKGIIVTHTKKCDGCRYCVQTDKTGTRPLAAIPVSYQDKTYRLCPLYPVWGYQWATFDDALMDKIITILDCVDGIYIRKGVI